MSGGGAAAAGAADAAHAARRMAAEILREGRFHESSVPRPLHSFLHWLGNVLSAPARAFTGLATLLGDILPGGRVTGWVVLAALLAAAAGLVARRYSRAALSGGGAGGPAAGGDGREATAAELERRAARAEAEGRFADAVRLRFRAGLRRLAEQGALPQSDAVPTREIAGRLRSEAFDGLARQFDAIAYGAAPARAADAEQAREGWRRVRAPAGRR